MCLGIRCFLSDLNTRWDDYNSAPPSRLEAFVWSTNRDSEDKEFDLWKASGSLSSTGFDLHEAPQPLTRLASSGNEFGPTYAAHARRGSSVGTYRPAPIVFASDRAGGAGKLDLYLATEKSILSLKHLNSAANDSYWCAFRHHDPCNSVGRPSAAYFASDRGGDYDIYEVRWTEGKRGGFDLYVAKWNAAESKWGTPKNPGRRYNMKHNEFRLALRH